MKKILLLFILAVSVSYCSEISQDMKMMNTLTLKCGLKNFKTYSLIITNLAVSGITEESANIFTDFASEHCLDEFIEISYILEKYDKRTQMAMATAAIASQMKQMAIYLENKYKEHIENAKLILRGR